MKLFRIWSSCCLISQADNICNNAFNNSSCLLAKTLYHQFSSGSPTSCQGHMISSRSQKSFRGLGSCRGRCLHREKQFLVHIYVIANKQKQQTKQNTSFLGDCFGDVSEEDLMLAGLEAWAGDSGAFSGSSPS